MRFDKAVIILKNKFFILGLMAALLAVIFIILDRATIYEKKDLAYGVTFSKQQAIGLGLDWRKVYLETFNDLGVRKIRLSAYWNEIEAQADEYQWGDTDWQIQTASGYDADIILAVGERLPRWPECHFPSWTSGVDEQTKEAKLFDYIKATVLRYKNNSHIIAWQVENEPFLPNFGECPPLNTDTLDREIALVRSLDTRPVVITDSGELSIWIQAASRADIFGTSIYRDTYSKRLGQYIHYPITPDFFRIKKNLVALFAKPAKWIVIELQAEPWGRTPFQDLSKKERDRTMDEQKFKDMIEFARQTGFREFYLWGVEWWYWEKTVQNDPALWADARALFNKTEIVSK